MKHFLKQAARRNMFFLFFFIFSDIAVSSSSFLEEDIPFPLPGEIYADHWDKTHDELNPLRTEKYYGILMDEAAQNKKNILGYLGMQKYLYPTRYSRDRLRARFHPTTRRALKARLSALKDYQ